MSTRSNEPHSSDQTSPVAPDVALRALESALDLGERETVGSQIGPYKLLQKIGEGGFGAVWMAEQHEPLRRRVALKIIKVGMDTDEVIARFEVERQALALMDHPNIARVYDAGATAAGRPYFVMELVRGVPITSYADENRLTPEARLQLFVAVCQAVQHAHQKGIIHRDLKPSNILVTLHDGLPVPKVIDFGIAKATGRQLTEKTLVTQFHAFVGTPVYTSPEQMEMSGLDVDTRSDIYSLGVLLYQLLAGRLPFDPDTLAKSGLEAMRRLIREVDPPRPSHRLGTLSAADRTSIASQRGTDAGRLAVLLRGDLDWIVMRCLEKDRTRRYETASGLGDDILRHLHHEPIAARPPSRGYRLAKLIRRHQLGFVAGALVAVAVVTGALLATWQAVRATQAEQEQSRLRTTAEVAAMQEAGARRLAEQQSVRAEQESRRAKDAAERLRLQAYVSDIRAAQSALESIRVLQTAEGPGEATLTPDGAMRHSFGGLFNFGRCRELLERHVPAPGQEDLRGFEWRYLWTLSRSHATAEFRQPYFMVSQAELLADGRTLVAGCGNSSVAVWDTVQARITRSFRTVANQWWLDLRFAVSPDGKRIAVCHGDGVAVYDTSSWQVVARNSTVARQAVFIPHSDELVLLSPKALVFWNLASGSATPVAINGANYWARLVASADGRQLYLNTGRRIVEVWHVASRRRASTVECDALIVALTASPDGRWLGIGYYDGSIALLSVPDWKRHGKTWAHHRWVNGLAFSPDSKLLASGGSDQLIRFWRVPDGENPAELVLADTLQGQRGMVCSLSFTLDGSQLVSAGSDWTARLWPVSAETRQPMEFIPWSQRHAASGRPGLPALHHSARHGIVWAVSGEDWTGWDFRSGRKYPPARFRDLPEWSEWVENWGGRLVYGTAEAVLAWNPLTERTERLASAKETSGLAGIVTVQGHEFLLLEMKATRQIEAWAGGATGPCREPWTEVLGAMVAQIPVRGERVMRRSRFLMRQTSDHRQLACLPTGDTYGETEFFVVLAAFDGSSGVRRLTGHLNNVYSFAFSPDSRLAASGSLDTLTRIWDLNSPAEPRVCLYGSNGPIYLQNFTPDGRTLITGDESILRFWNVRTGEALLTLPGDSVASGDNLGPDRWVVPPEADDGLLIHTNGKVRFTPVPSLAAIDAERAAARRP